MLDRRTSPRLALHQIAVREMNGEYLYSLKAKDLSEEGIFLENKFCVGELEPYSKLTFTLPDGTHFHNLLARIVREQARGISKGCAYEFLNLSEETRMQIKRALSKQVA